MGKPHIGKFSASITWILRIVTLAAHSKHVIEVLGEPVQELASAKRIVHIYENIRDADTVASMRRSLVPVLTKVAKLHSVLKFQAHVNVRFMCAREDYFAIFSPSIIQALAAANAHLELYFVGGPSSEGPKLEGKGI